MNHVELNIPSVKLFRTHTFKTQKRENRDILENAGQTFTHTAINSNILFSDGKNYSLRIGEQLAESVVIAN